MDKTHPHAGATYRVMPLAQGGFCVEVAIPDTCPTMVSGFRSEEAAMAWVAGHQEQVRVTTSLSRSGSRFNRAIGTGSSSVRWR